MVPSANASTAGTLTSKPPRMLSPSLAHPLSLFFRKRLSERPRPPPKDPPARDSVAPGNGRGIERARLRARAKRQAADFAPIHKQPIYKAGGVLVEHPPALHGLTRTRITAKFYGPPALVSTKYSSGQPAQKRRRE